MWMLGSETILHSMVLNYKMAILILQVLEVSSIYCGSLNHLMHTIIQLQPLIITTGLFFNLDHI